MDNKEKIRLLADLQDAMENEELKELVIALPSGEKVFSIFEAALSKELEALLAGKTQEETKKEEQWSSLIQSLDKSMVLHILRSMNDKLAQPSGAPAPTQGGAPQPAGNFPPEETEAVDQEELKRRWQEQQLSAGTGRQRGGVAGPY